MGSMDRKKWLTTIYREANLFIERQTPPGGSLTVTEVDELEPELHDQLQEVMRSIDQLEDLIKHSLMKNPSPDLWYGENNWQHVVAAVASACLLHDVKGIVKKILEGTLPRTPSETLLDAL